MDFGGQLQGEQFGAVGEIALDIYCVSWVDIITWVFYLFHLYQNFPPIMEAYAQM